MDHPREVIEAALAHVVQNQVEAARPGLPTGREYTDPAADHQSLAPGRLAQRPEPREQTPAPQPHAVLAPRIQRPLVGRRLRQVAPVDLLLPQRPAPAAASPQRGDTDSDSPSRSRLPTPSVTPTPRSR